MAGKEELDKFLADPKIYLPPLAPHTLPNHLPKRLSSDDLRRLFPAQIEYQGYCPVTYIDGGQR